MMLNSLVVAAEAFVIFLHGAVTWLHMKVVPATNDQPRKVKLQLKVRIINCLYESPAEVCLVCLAWLVPQPN